MAIAGNTAASADPAFRASTTTAEPNSHALVSRSSTSAANLGPGIAQSIPIVALSHALSPANVAAVVATSSAMVPDTKSKGFMAKVKQLITGADQTLPLASTINTGFQTLASTLECLMKVGGLIAKVHPFAAAAWSVIAVAYEIIKANDALDESIQLLLDAMNHACKLAASYKPKNHHAGPNIDTIIQSILCQVVKGAHIMTAYGKARNQKSATLKLYFSTLQQDVNKCSEKLRLLHKKLSEYASAETLTTVQRMEEAIEDLSMSQN
ncbi:hypothetical protein DL93DRAFT_610329 [Clavulina sp. PMI_390]|nr:hypothetical protein DL93DRAFT_610329 [Clavulina sp. PMI_390]